MSATITSVAAFLGISIALILVMVTKHDDWAALLHLDLYIIVIDFPTCSGEMWMNIYTMT
jgi:hypothetical protein